MSQRFCAGAAGAGGRPSPAPSPASFQRPTAQALASIGKGSRKFLEEMTDDPPAPDAGVPLFPVPSVAPTTTTASKTSTAMKRNLASIGKTSRNQVQHPTSGRNVTNSNDEHWARRLLCGSATAGTANTDAATPIVSDDSAEIQTQRIMALNELLKLSASHDVNFALQGDQTLNALVYIAMVECLGYDDDVAERATRSKRYKSGGNNSHQGVDEEPEIVLESHTAWSMAPTAPTRWWLQHCEQRLGHERSLFMTAIQLHTLEVILTILRNLSYTAANLRLLAYTPSLLVLLAGCCCERTAYPKQAYYDRSKHPHIPTMDYYYSTGFGTLENALGGFIPHAQLQQRQQEQQQYVTSTSLAVVALQTLMNLLPCIDVTGKRYVTDILFYDPSMIVNSKDGEPPLLPTMTATLESTGKRKFHSGPPKLPVPTIPLRSSPPANTSSVDAGFGRIVQNQWGYGSLWYGKRFDFKDDTLIDIDKEVIAEFAQDYLVAVYTMFPPLARIFVDIYRDSVTMTRAAVIAALDVFYELVSHARVGVVGSVEDVDGNELRYPSLRAIMARIPDEVLHVWTTSMLFLPRLGPDAFDYLDPIHNNVTRVNSYKVRW
jgi:hypothetical protein